MALDILNSLFSKGNNQSEDYKRGFEACEKRYKRLEMERDTAVRQINKLGYELGEELDPLKEASNIKKMCRGRTSCDGCPFDASGACVLKGETPGEWMVL